MSHRTVLTMYLLCFLTWEHLSCVAVYGVSDSSPLSLNILICVPKIDEGLTGLEQHEGE